jgi:hypothetical protein
MTKRKREEYGSNSNGNKKKVTRWEELAKHETVTSSDARAGGEDESAARTAKPGSALAGAAGEEPDEGDLADEQPPDEEEEDLEDYTKDYYESEGESGDGDGEATF